MKKHSSIAVKRAKKQPWYSEGIRFECRQSAKCCVNHGDYSYVYLTRSDEKRLHEHLGIDRDDFRKRYTELVDGYRVLRSTDDACVFLQDRSCGVYQARPIQCATWPFWPETLDEETWRTEVVPFCPGVGTGRRYSREEIEELLELTGDGSRPRTKRGR